MRDYAWFVIILGLFAAMLFAADNNAGSAFPTWYDDGTLIAQREGGNFISGSGITVTGVDDPANSQVDITIATTGLTPSRFGEMDDNSNTDPFVINATTDIHSYHSNALHDGALNEWDFDAGGAGASVAVASVANAGGGQVLVTTGGAHNLVVGAIVSITDTTSYNAVYIVDTVPLGTTFTVTAAWLGDEAGTMDEAATLTAGVGAAGTYILLWSASATPATLNETFDYYIYNGETQQIRISSRRKFGGVGDFGSMGGSGFLTVAPGDKLSFALANTDSGGDLTIRHFDFNLHQI